MGWGENACLCALLIIYKHKNQTNIKVNFTWKWFLLFLFFFPVFFSLVSLQIFVIFFRLKPKGYLQPTLIFLWIRQCLSYGRVKVIIIQSLLHADLSKHDSKHYKENARYSLFDLVSRHIVYQNVCFKWWREMHVFSKSKIKSCDALTVVLSVVSQIKRVRYVASITTYVIIQMFMS